ncbi:MAG: hypothetical protein PHU13_03550 [Acholeplasmataceae bacterium]|jgi:hypothetical protein|nr:hypothetical protein [Acholeplasmataceae bacterium]MDD4824332.1 hypothetical protein [Acholeplasmataceae bacterium]
MQENNKDMLMDWNDSIEEDGQGYILLPEGDYNFTVTSFERGRFPGGPKVPACNKATITVQVDTKEGIATVKFDLLLFRSLEWRISDFFRCIGQKKHGEKLTMDWNKVIGSKGRAHFKQRSYTNNQGEEKFTNDISRFLDYKEEFFVPYELPF